MDKDSGVGLTMEQFYQISKLPDEVRNGVNFSIVLAEMDVVAKHINLYIESRDGQIEPALLYLLKMSNSFSDKIRISIFNILSESNDFLEYKRAAAEAHSKLL